MSDAVDRMGNGFFKAAKSVAIAAGFEHSGLGRALLARFNVMGEKVARRLVLRERSFKIDGHLIYLAGQTGPSVSFSAAMLSEQYEQEVTKLLNESLRPGMNVLDVGAHVGCHALAAARLVGPGGTVYAFEPSPDNFALLEKNIALNGYKNIVPIQKAIAEKSGTVSFHLSAEGNDRNSIYASSRASHLSTRIEVPVISLDDFLEQRGWPTIHFVKIDVEGAEPLVLRGMAKLLLRSPELGLMVEFAPACIRESGYAPLSFLQDLASHEFHIDVLQEKGASTPLHATDFSAFAAQVETEGMRNLICYLNSPR